MFCAIDPRLPNSKMVIPENTQRINGDAGHAKEKTSLVKVESPSLVGHRRRMTMDDLYLVVHYNYTWWFQTP